MENWERIGIKIGIKVEKIWIKMGKNWDKDGVKVKKNWDKIGGNWGKIGIKVG